MYLPNRSHTLFPSDLDISWSNASLDETMANALRDSAKMIHGVALADGQNVSHAAVYVSYAIFGFGTLLEDIYDLWWERGEASQHQG